MALATGVASNGTIAAIATATGNGSIGVVRVSGDKVLDILAKVLTVPNRTPGPWMDKRVVLGLVSDSCGNVIDQCICLLMLAPRSYTGEDVLELQCHGGKGVMHGILRSVLRAGARIAEPGEFTRRAFENGKIDLTQAEAICEMINSRTEQSARVVAKQLGGTFGKRIQPVKDEIMAVLANVQASIDYADEVDSSPAEWVSMKLGACLDDVNGIIRDCERGMLLRDGYRVVLAGKPNVGKSSLLNALLGYEKAIVTEIAGTTRDIIEDHFHLEGVPVIISDTAGLRETREIVEMEGIARARRALDEADLVLKVFDGSAPLDADDMRVLRGYGDKRSIMVLNKSDKGCLDETLATIRDEVRDACPVPVSAKDRTGIDALFEGVSAFILSDLEGSGVSDPIVANLRQVDVLESCRNHLSDAVNGMAGGIPLDLVSIDVSDGLNDLMALTGENLSDELLDMIFSNFCVGK